MSFVPQSVFCTSKRPLYLKKFKNTLAVSQKRPWPHRRSFTSQNTLQHLKASFSTFLSFSNVLKYLKTSLEPRKHPLLPQKVHRIYLKTSVTTLPHNKTSSRHMPRHSGTLKSSKEATPVPPMCEKIKIKSDPRPPAPRPSLQNILRQLQHTLQYPKTSVVQHVNKTNPLPFLDTCFDTSKRPSV